MSSKMISPEALIAEFRRALSEGWGYIWGTAGEKWTAAKQKELEKTTDADRAQGRQYGSKWIGKTVADCSGLFSWAFKRLGGYMYHGSDTMYKKYCTNKGELKAGKRTDYGTLRPGTAVFVWNGRTYSHVGLYVGDNTVIEAMSTINGVTTTKVTAGKWTHWGELAGVEYSGNSAIAVTQIPMGAQVKDLDSCSMGSISCAEAQMLPQQFIIQNSELTDQPQQGSSGATLRRGDKGQAVTEMQTLLMKLGYDLGSYGVDGDFGKDTEAAVKRFQRDHGLTVDGVVGSQTRAALEAAVQKTASNVIPSRVEGSPESYSVTISGLDLTQAKAIAANYPGNSEIEIEVG